MMPDGSKSFQADAPKHRPMILPDEISAFQDSCKPV
jgi:hypothetical protein